MISADLNSIFFLFLFFVACFACNAIILYWRCSSWIHRTFAARHLAQNCVFIYTICALFSKKKNKKWKKHRKKDTFNRTYFHTIIIFSASPKFFLYATQLFQAVCVFGIEYTIFFSLFEFALHVHAQLYFYVFGYLVNLFVVFLAK